MGIFSKDNKAPAPAAPSPAPMPAAPSAPSPAAPAPSMSPEENVPGLPTPPMPGASLEDIKSQVSAPSSMPVPAPTSMPTPEPAQSTEMSRDIAMPESSSSSSDDELDSLFDISDLDLPEDSEGISEEEHSTLDDDIANEEESTPDVSSYEPQQVSEVDQSQQFIAHHKEVNDSKPFFVTTSQFKALLEIIENVKQKTKESSERHLRLLDIKAEEDIEYENLKKDFAFIEDKLYEVDTLIFEND